jgi:hypothetical protein
MPLRLQALREYVLTTDYEAWYDDAYEAVLAEMLVDCHSRHAGCDTCDAKARALLDEFTAAAFHHTNATL